MNLKSVKAVIFDLDGTLLNSLGDLTDAVNFAVKPLGVKPSTELQIKDRVGNGAKKLLERTLKANNAEGDIDKCFERFSSYYREHMTCKTHAYDGIMELLQKLKKAGIKTAILSNKFDLAAKEIAEHYFGELIDYTQGEKQGVPRKPDPTACLEIMSMLGIEKENTVYIGDSTVDVQTAKSAGLFCIAVSWGYCDRQLIGDADIVVDRPYEIENVIFGTDFESIEKNFKRRGFGFSLFEDKQSAVEYIAEKCKNKSVGFGGSVTLDQMNMFDVLKEQGTDVHWHWRGEDVYMNGEVYITSANGLSQSGEIVNIDGRCNRISATLYGTKHCIIVCGINKLAPDLEKTIERARNIAAPRNAQRLNKAVPCVKTGKCMDCSSKERICRAMAILMNPPSGMECEVVLIKENLGY